MAEIQNLYVKFLQYFPVSAQPIVSLILAVLVIYSAFRVVKKDFIFIIVLIVLVPGSIPILKSIWHGLVGFIQFLFNQK